MFERGPCFARNASNRIKAPPKTRENNWRAALLRTAPFPRLSDPVYRLAWPHLIVRQRRAAKGAGPVIPTDAEGTASFVNSVLPAGFVHDYLRAGQLAVLLGDTLFVHGGLEGSGCRWIPDLGLRYFDRETGGVVAPVGRYLPETAAVSEWVDALNAFASVQRLRHHLGRVGRGGRFTRFPAWPRATPRTPRVMTYTF